MNKIKQAFGEQFGDLSKAQKRIKSNVIQKKNKKKRKIFWHYPIVAAVILFVAVGFLWSHISINKEQERLGTLSKQYFEVMHFDSFFLSQEFNRKAENYEQVFHLVLREAAMIDYAKKQGVVVTEEEIETLKNNYLVSFKEGRQNSMMTEYRFEVLFKEFNLSDESYVRLLAEQNLISEVYTQRLFEKLKIDQNPNDEAYQEVISEALSAYYEQYYTQLEEMLAEFKPFPRDGLTGEVETLYTIYGEYEVVELEGKLRFAKKADAINQLLVNGMTEINEIMDEENLGYLCFYTLDDYIKNSKERIESSANMEDLHDLLIILKQTVELY